MSKKNKQKLNPYQHFNKNDETEKHKKKLSTQSIEIHSRITKQIFVNSNENCLLVPTYGPFYLFNEIFVPDVFNQLNLKFNLSTIVHFVVKQTNVHSTQAVSLYNTIGASAKNCLNFIIVEIMSQWKWMKTIIMYYIITKSVLLFDGIVGIAFVRGHNHEKCHFHYYQLIVAIS